jgi:RND family efflux transporter MFP subunit
MKKWGVIIIAIFIALIAVVAIRKEIHIKRIAYPQQPAYVVQAAIAKTGDIDDYENYLGEFINYDEAVIKTRVSSTILYCLDEGNSFKKGDVIVRLDDTDIRNSIKALEFTRKALQSELIGQASQTEASYVLYENTLKTYNRYTSLYKKKVISKQELENVQNVYEQAKASFNIGTNKLKSINDNIGSVNAQIIQVSNNLRYTEIRAPFSGAVTAKFLNVGDLAAIGSPIIQIDGSLGGYKILVNVPIYKQIEVGTKAIVSYKDKSIEDPVARVLESAKDNLATVELLLNDNPLKVPSHTYLSVSFVTGRASGVTVPYNAVFRNSENHYFILKVVDGHTKLTPVVVKAKNDKYACVSGINSGDVVLVGYESKLLSIPDNVKVQALLDK